MEKLQIPFLIVALIGAGTAFLFYLYSLWFSQITLKKIAKFITIVSLVMITMVIGLRTMVMGALPLTNMFEFGLFFVWAIILVYLIIEQKFAVSASSLFVLPIAILLLIWLLNLDSSIRPAMPALRSNWLVVHVLTAVVAYGAFAISFALSLMYLFQDWLINKKSKNKIISILPSLEILDEISYKITFIGMPFLTIMMVTGAVWAEYTWGSYWSWDPKETWALITWFIYSAYLHVRFLAGWKGRRAAMLSILGFLAVIFTFIGVTYLLPGIHSYA